MRELLNIFAVVITPVIGGAVFNVLIRCIWRFMQTVSRSHSWRDTYHKYTMPLLHNDAIARVGDAVFCVDRCGHHVYLGRFSRYTKHGFVTVTRLFLWGSI